MPPALPQCNPGNFLRLTSDRTPIAVLVDLSLARSAGITLGFRAAPADSAPIAEWSDWVVALLLADGQDVGRGDGGRPSRRRMLPLDLSVGAIAHGWESRARRVLGRNYAGARQQLGEALTSARSSGQTPEWMLWGVSLELLLHHLAWAARMQAVQAVQASPVQGPRVPTALRWSLATYVDAPELPLTWPADYAVSAPLLVATWLLDEGVAAIEDHVDPDLARLRWPLWTFVGAAGCARADCPLHRLLQVLRDQERGPGEALLGHYQRLASSRRRQALPTPEDQVRAGLGLPPLREAVAARAERVAEALGKAHRVLAEWEGGTLSGSDVTDLTRWASLSGLGSSEAAQRAEGRR